MRKLPNIETLVVKIGSNILMDEAEGLSSDFISRLTSELSNLRKTVRNIVIVSSGAVGAGYKLLGFENRPKNITDKQACAAIGQTRLIWEYEREFAKYGFHVGQILITKDDFSNRRRYLNARYSIRRLLELGVIPVINENDSVVVDELKHVESFGDNDNLSALVSGLIGADMLLILSDVDGLYSADPATCDNAKRFKEIKYMNEDIFSIAGESVSDVGTGGMRSKINAAQKALKAGCYVGIINGRNPANITDFLSGQDTGTFFSHIEDPINRRKQWIAYAAKVKGEITVDTGAVNALTNGKKSLLPSGITDVSGRFSIGDVISIKDEAGLEIAKGKSRYSSADLKKIKGRKTTDIFDILGYKFSDEAVHRDDLVINDTPGL